MGIYATHVLPRLIDRACGRASMAVLRQRVCRGLHGRVLEIGFGSGHNLRHLPSGVTGVAAVEPADVAWQLAGKRLQRAEATVERVGLDGRSIPLPDHSCDTAVSTWTLCTIPDPVEALREVRRVLVPGGTLHFVEHGLAPDPGVQRLQRRLEPLQRRVAGGCHLTRQIPELIEAAGFAIRELDTFYEDQAPRFVGADSLGVAAA